MTGPDRGRLIHAIDQIGGVLEDLAPLLRQFYEALVRARFSPRQALELTKAALQELIRQGRERRREERRDGGDVP